MVYERPLVIETDRYAPVVLRFRGIPSSGYIWEFTHNAGAMIQEESVSLSPAKPGEDVEIGGEVDARFTVYRLVEDQAEIVFKYHRPWENAEPSDYLRVLLVPRKKDEAIGLWQILAQKARSILGDKRNKS